MISLEQQTSINSQSIYFSRNSNQIEIDRNIADGNLEGLHSLSPFTQEQAARAMAVSAYCDKGEIFDYLFETYKPDLWARNQCLESFATLGDLKRVERILDYGNISEKSKIDSLRNAMHEGHFPVISRLMDLGISKKNLQTLSLEAEQNGLSPYVVYFRNAADAAS